MKTRKQLYEAALGRPLAATDRALGFLYATEGEQQAAHYALIMSGAQYLLYDGWHKQAVVLVGSKEGEQAVRAVMTGVEFEPSMSIAREI